MASVFVLGIAVLDHVFYLPRMPDRAAKYRTDRYAAIVGGCAATAAAAIVRLGGQARLATNLGDDANSETILAALAEAGVDTAATQQAAGGRAAISSVVIDAEGERQIVNFRGAGRRQDADWLHAGHLEGAGAVLVDTRWPAAATKAAELAAPVGLPVVVDAEQPYDDAEALLAAATHLAFPREGLHSLVGHDDVATALEEAHRRYGGWIAVTDGARGVSFTSGEAAGHADALSVAAVDTLGAGDVWHGAFALALAEGRDEGAAAVFANAAAALKCANGAGWGAIPTRQDVDAALNRAP